MHPYIFLPLLKQLNYLLAVLKCLQCAVSCNYLISSSHSTLAQEIILAFANAATAGPPEVFFFFLEASCDYWGILGTSTSPANDAKCPTLPILIVPSAEECIGRRID